MWSRVDLTGFDITMTILNRDTAFDDSFIIFIRKAQSPILVLYFI